MLQGGDSEHKWRIQVGRGSSPVCRVARGACLNVVGGYKEDAAGGLGDEVGPQAPRAGPALVPNHHVAPDHVPVARAHVNATCVALREKQFRDSVRVEIWQYPARLNFV